MKLFTKKKNDKRDNINKLYITFSDYEIKNSLKNKIILVDNKKYKLKKADMHPQDINWENLNINKKSKIKRRILSYLLIFIFLFSYYLLVTIISAYQNTFQRKYNLLTDCSNVDYKNNINLIYNEYKNFNQNEKEKVYIYCFCSNNSKTIIYYNEISFDPCIDYKKYKYRRKAFIYLLSIILFFIDLLVDTIVDKIISIQKFESKSNQNILNIIITIITLIFSNVISVVLINSKIYIKNLSEYFGDYEDITPQWVNEMSDNMTMNFAVIFFEFLWSILMRRLLLLAKPLNQYILYIFENPIMHFYEYFKLYIPQIDYSRYLINIIYYFFIFSILIFNPFYSCLTSFILIFFAIIDYFSYELMFRFTFVLNKTYFRISFSLVKVIFIFYILFGIWWYSSEYFFLDINENIYNEFYCSNKSLIDKFLKGNASISEKIKLKCLLKRNIIFFILLIFIIITEFCRVIFCQKKKYKKKIDKNILQLDNYSKIKYYEYYKLIKTKLDIIYSKNDNSIKELYNYIHYKLNELKKEILGNENRRGNNEIILIKKKIIKEKQLVFNNPDYTYSPFLLNDYNISFTSKFILSPSFG